MKESTIESKVCAYARSKGILPIKNAAPGHRGIPDRMFLKDGKVMFIEFKAPGKTPTALQRKWLEDLKEQGFRATWTDNVTEGCHDIDLWLLLDFK